MFLMFSGGIEVEPWLKMSCPFFRKALEVPFLKEVTKNVHEN